MAVSMNKGPKLGKITRHAGIAGQYSYSVQVTYPGEPTERLEFVGSTYGGRVLMVTPAGAQTFVAREVMDRCGATLDERWVRRFFA